MIKGDVRVLQEFQKYIRRRNVDYMLTEVHKKL